MTLDCGDNSCMFSTSKGGMRTNGGCRCFEAAGYSRSAIASAIKLLPEVLELKEKVKELTNKLVHVERYKSDADRSLNLMMITNKVLEEQLNKLKRQEN